MRVKLEKAELQLELGEELRQALECLARLDAGMRVLNQKITALEAAMAKVATSTGKGIRRQDAGVDEMLRKDDVMKMTGLSSTSLWRKEKDGLFPKRINLAGRGVGWQRSEVQAWIEEQKAA